MSALTEWLAHPYIEVRITDTSKVKEMRKQIETLEREVLRLRALYGQECNINMRLQELLKRHGVEWR